MNHQPFNLKVISLGTVMTGICVAIGYFTIPQKPEDSTEKVSDLNDIKLASQVAESQQQVSSLPTLQGKEGYDRFCQQCHGATGIETTPLARTMEPSPTNLKFGPFKVAQDVESLVNIILKGVVSANGVKTMPGFVF